MAGSLVNTALSVYDFGWKFAKPILALNHRLKEGWEQRTLGGGLPAPADVWIQAASGGEAYLAKEVLARLKPHNGKTLRVLATSNTRQGVETLERVAAELNGKRNGIAVQTWYFPFDAPSTMLQMMEHVRPKLMLILETEIWPGLLAACKAYKVKVLLANGRMSTRSLGGYLAWPGFFRELGPDRIMAVSDEDGRRFGTLFGRDKVWVMPNMKFDRMIYSGPISRSANPLASFIGEGQEFIVFGSVRKQELAPVRELAAGVMRRRPSAVLGIFPRHMHHVPLWEKAMNRAGVRYGLRSTFSGRAEPGTVVIWDTFGELVPAYGLADAAFVGGSLAQLGGQNFLEPLTCGVKPVIGPHWRNFAWIGREIIETGLVREARNSAEVLECLVETLDERPNRTDVVAKARAYIGDRRGGADAVCKQVAHFLDKD